MEKNIEDAQVNILLEIDDQIHLVAMEKQHLDAIDLLVKSSISSAIPVGKNQDDLLKFLGRT